MTIDDVLKEIHSRRETLERYISDDLQKSPYTNKSNFQFYRVAHYELGRLLECITDKSSAQF